MAGRNPYYGGGFKKQEAPLGLMEYQRMISQGDPNSPLYNQPIWQQRQANAGPQRGTEAITNRTNWPEQNVDSIAKQIDSNLSNMQAAKDLNDVVTNTDWADMPGKLMDGTTNFVSDVGTGIENVGEGAKSLFTEGYKPDYGLLSDNLMKGVGTVPDVLPPGPNLPGNIQGSTGMANHASNAAKMPPPSAGATSGGQIASNTAGTEIGQNLPASLPPANANMTAQGFSPEMADAISSAGIDPSKLAGGGRGLLGSANKGIDAVSASANQTAQNFTGMFDAPASLMNDAAVGATEAAKLGSEASKTAVKGATKGAETAATGWGGKVLPGIGAGLSIYDMVDNGVNAGNIMGLGSSMAFLAPAAMGLGPLGWALAGGSMLGSLFDWW
jgi:hypothetical protein